MTKQAVATSPPLGNLPGFLRTLRFPLILCVAVFCYVWLRVEPAIEHHMAGPFFFLSRSFAEPFLGRPGGTVEYISVFLGQLQHFSWLGALVFSCLCFLVYNGAQLVLGRVAGEAGRSALVPLVMVLLLTLLRNQYGSPALRAGLGLLLAMGAAWGWLACGKFPVVGRWAASLILSSLLLYLSGVWPCLLFAVLTGLAEGTRKKSWFPGMLGVLAGLLPCAVLAISSEVSLKNLIHPWGSGYNLFLVMAAHAALPLAAAVVLYLAHRAPVPTQVQKPHRRPKGPQSHALPWHRAERALIATLLFAGAVALWLNFDQRAKDRAEIDYLATRRDYAGVLALAPRQSVIDLSSQIRLHAALYHSGSLSSNLFAYTYPSLPNLLPGIVGGLPTCRAQAQTLFELGLVSDAEHLAHEALEHEGNRPDLLRTLAQINVLKGRPAAAQVFLNVLNQVPFERAWATACLRDLEANPQLSDPEICRIRSCLLTNDLAHSGLPAQALLSRLLMTNQGNKMAFEYLLCSYLLDMNLTNALGAIQFLKGLGYPSIPRHLEEALLLHQHLTGHLVDLQGYQVSATTRQRFEEFRNLLSRLPDQGPQSRRALAEQFRDTYWCYYVLNESIVKSPSSRPPDS